MVSGCAHLWRGWLFAALIAGTMAVERSACAADWHIVSPTKVEDPAIALPPLAVVESRDESGKTWRLSGKSPGSPAVARQDFKLALEKQGWRLDKVIPVGQGQRASNLCLWKKGQQSIMLMLWEASAGETGFSLGVDQ